MTLLNDGGIVSHSVEVEDIALSREVMVAVSQILCVVEGDAHQGVVGKVCADGGFYAVLAFVNLIHNEIMCA